MGFGMRILVLDEPSLDAVANIMKEMACASKPPAKGTCIGQRCCTCFGVRCVRVGSFERLKISFLLYLFGFPCWDVRLLLLDALSQTLNVALRFGFFIAETRK